MKYLVLLGLLAVALGAEKAETERDDVSLPKTGNKKTPEKRGLAGVAYGFGVPPPAVLGLAAPVALPSLALATLAAPALAAPLDHPLAYATAPAAYPAFAAPAVGYAPALPLSYAPAAAPVKLSALGYSVSTLAYDHAALGLGYGLGNAITAYSGPIVGALPAVHPNVGPAIPATPLAPYASAPFAYKAGYY